MWLIKNLLGVYMYLLPLYVYCAMIALNRRNCFSIHRWFAKEVSTITSRVAEAHNL